MSTRRDIERELPRDVAVEIAGGEWRRPVLVTGGAGFIGCNLAHRLLSEGRPVIILDNLSRAGVRRNIDWLRATHGRGASLEVADVREREAVRHAVRWCESVFHFAAQVAVTTSLAEPREDFEVNVGGTLNVLEAIRALDEPPPLVFTSTNKVYGAIEDVRLRRNGDRWEPKERAVRDAGIGEERRLDFHSPYGCSKGAADQYVRDYARSFGLRTVVFRMSCIYGPHQFGTEDQGWVAHFLIRALEGAPIDLYGDGMQVRDVLFVEDLVNALLLAERHVDELSGDAYNIGGGPSNTVSLLELLDLIEELHGERPATRLHGWRVGDQRYYVSDTARFREATGWTPTVGVREGVGRLYDWLRASRAAERVERVERAVATSVVAERGTERRRAPLAASMRPVDGAADAGDVGDAGALAGTGHVA